MSAPVKWLTTWRRFVELFPEFLAPSWAAWRSIGAAIMGEPPEDPGFVLRVTGRATLLLKLAYAVFVGAGRGSGKSRFVGLWATFMAVGREYKLAPGENVFVTVHSPTKRQSIITFKYILGLLKSVPSFAAMIVRESTDSVELSNGVIVEVGTADYRTPRGRSIVCAIIEEGAFLPTDDSATPDSELIRALRPALARVPGSLLLFVSSPYARRGELFKAFRKHHGNDASDSLYVKATTLELNPTFDERAIAAAYEDDPASAAAEHGAEFRLDVETLLTREALDAVTVPGRIELPPQPGVQYVAFFDAAGGSGADSQTLGIAHTETRNGRPIAVLDCLREVRPPFSPETVLDEFAGVLRSYQIARLVSDRYAADWPVEQWRKRGISCQPSDKTASDIYREVLPLVNSGGVELLDVARLTAQLAGLERRASRSGKDSISHPPGGHDDVAVAAAGALVLTAQPRVRLQFFGGGAVGASDDGWIEAMVDQWMAEQEQETAS